MIDVEVDVNVVVGALLGWVAVARVAARARVERVEMRIFRVIGYRDWQLEKSAIFEGGLKNAYRICLKKR